MVSPKVMASSSSRNSDLRRRSSSKSVASDQGKSGLGSMTVDGLLRNVYSAAPASESTLVDAEITLVDSGTGAMAELEGAPSAKTVDDVWREIVAGGGGRRECKEEVEDDMMTLEDFLAKAGAVEEEGEDRDVKVPLVTQRLSGGIFAFDPVPPSPITPAQVEGSVIGFGNGMEIVGGRGKRRAPVLEPLDKAAQQKQRRMIKNRESAARSRERKQAYQVELESSAVRLEEENEQLLKEKAERSKERLKQLMEKIIPVVERRKPARILRRVRSMEW